MSNKKYVLDLAKVFGFDKLEVDELSKSLDATSLSRKMSVIRASKMNESEMAKKLKVKKSYIEQLENADKAIMNIGDIERYLNVLGYKFSYRIIKKKVK